MTDSPMRASRIPEPPEGFTLTSGEFETEEDAETVLGYMQMYGLRFRREGRRIIVYPKVIGPRLQEGETFVHF